MTRLVIIALASRSLGIIALEPALCTGAAAATALCEDIRL